MDFPYVMALVHGNWLPFQHVSTFAEVLGISLVSAEQIGVGGKEKFVFSAGEGSVSLP